jgi:Tol biopolymer transport system component/DNA-binding winged helix-turn-helix (wHTH) protein
MSRSGEEIYEFGGFRLDVSEHLLLNSEGENINLPAKVFAALCLLVRNSGSLVSKDDLIGEIWGGVFVEENNLDKIISALRRALGEKRGEKVFIETVRKQGYRFVAEVAPITNEEKFSPKSKPPFVSASAKDTAAHSYNFERRGNVLTVADWTAESETATDAETLTTGVGDLSPRPESPLKSGSIAAPANSRRPANRAAPLLVILTLLGGIAFSITRYSTFSLVTAQDSFRQISFRKVVGTDGGYSPTISPDGKTTAYRDSDLVIWIENLTTGSRIQLKNGTEPLKGIWLKFAPDGNYLYYVWQAGDERQNSIFRVAVPGGTPRKVADNVWTGAAVSPDGKEIAFARQNPEAAEHAIYIAESDGTNERKIAAHISPNWFSIYGNYLAWSPDGKKIACIGGAPDHKPGDMASLLVVNIADGAEFVVPNPDWQTRELDELTWSADGNNLLVVAKDSVNSPYQIWQVSYPQGVWRRITNDLNNYSKVDVSAGGKELITTQEKSSVQLWQLPAGDSDRASQITAGQTYSDGSHGLSFTPDGKHIIYASNQSGSYEIWTSNADGSERRQLTFGSESSTEPTVTPDNRYIVFVRTTNTSPHLWRMDTDGNNLRQLTYGKGEFQQPAVTLDGRFVIYTGYSRAPNTDLFRISIDGGEPAQLTSKFSSSMPVVSPDGQSIAYHFYNHEIARPFQVGIMPIDGGEPVKTFEMPARGLLRWAADGKSFLYVGKDSINLWQMALYGDAPPRQITDFKTGAIYGFALSPDAKQIVAARGNTETNIIEITDNTIGGP